MKIDMHFHIIGNGIDINNVDNDVYMYADDNHHWFTRILYNLVEDDLARMEADLNSDGKISTSEYFDVVYRLVTSAEEIDGVVLLALDAVYSPRTGKINKQKTDLWVSNKFLSRKVRELNDHLQNESDAGKRKKRFFFGASINPNRKDWESELEYVITQTDAVLIKIIPSTQHIYLMDDRHRNFYNALSSYNMPLLCHVGPEYSFPEGMRKKHLDNFKYLEKPLEHDVTVIAAHCSTPVFPMIDPNLIGEFYSFMKKANSDGKVRLWADTSALSLSTRLSFIQQIVETFPSKWLVNGSDFPIPIDGWPHLPLVTHDITPEEYIAICKTKNPLDRDVRIKRAHGFADSILRNAERVLRLPRN
ncbi:MAG: amidohydrolase family protein [Thermodesulfovibrionales bacterium]|nr:amidohydrolase family protein [Thermodesulfovibrionales bacterium]